MKKIILAFTFLFLIPVVIYSQKTTTNGIVYNSVLKERVFLHYNTSLLLTGEYLHYKVYVLRDRNNKLSKLSKIAYVELVDSEKKVVFKHKVRLENSTGNGDFFIPSSIKSGNYKLISYTQGMRNEKGNYFFQGDLTILNPFQPISPLAIQKEITSNTIAVANKKNTIQQENDLETIVIDTSFTTRSKVTINLETLNKKYTFGNYSISVRKIDALQKPVLLNSKTYTNLFPKKENKNNSLPQFRPEFTGELLTGKVYEKTSGKPVMNKRVLLSIANESPVLKFSKTNALGEFIFKLKVAYDVSKATLQILGKDTENYTIVVDKHIPLNYETLSFKDFQVAPNIKEILLENSIQNQIENAYLSVKKDTISVRKAFKTYSFDYVSKTFLLDDYTRFSTVKETITEIVKNVSISRKKKNYVFRVANLNPYDKEKFLPLIIVDGVLTQSLNELALFDARKVKSISVVRNKFYFENFNYQGIIYLETFNNDFNVDVDKNKVHYFDLFTPVKNKKYFSPNYTDKKSYDRIPDYRKQLLWQPNFTLESKENALTFFTSDVKGVYEISIEGFQKDGTPISIKDIIYVE